MKPTDQSPAAPVTAEGAVGVNRREFLALAGASMALAGGTAGCVRKPPREVISRREGPEYREPGRVLNFATTWMDGPFPYGMLVAATDGRPIKVEGNPDHPVGGGASTMAMQAALLGLYDPRRLDAPRGTTTWNEADARIRAALDEASSVVLITRATLGESERVLVDTFAHRYPATHRVYEPAADQARREVWRRCHGAPGEWLPHFDRAEVILSVGSDFLGTDGAVLEATEGFAATRGVTGEASEARMSRLWVAEAGVTLTGMNADHRLAIAPSGAAALLTMLRTGLEDGPMNDEARRLGLDPALIISLRDDLRRAGTRALVVAGPQHPPAVHAAATLLNHALEAPGTTLRWNPTPANMQAHTPAQIREALGDGPDVLITLGVDPVADWPGGGFEELIRAAGLSVAHSVFPTATTGVADIALPSHHGLESWNDAAPRAGLRSLCQPTIRPLLDTRQEAVSLQLWTEEEAPDRSSDGARKELRFHRYLKQRWLQEILQHEPLPEEAFTLALQRGVHGTVRDVDSPDFDEASALALAAETVPTGGVEIEFLPDNRVYDGRDAPLAWLLEIPDPVTHQMWGNAAHMGRALAEELGIRDGDMIRLARGEHTLELPAAVMPGTAPGCVSLTLGMGRTHPVLPERTVGHGVATLLPDQGRTLAGARVEVVAGHEDLIYSQLTFDMHERPLVLGGTLAEYRANSHFVEEQQPHVPEHTSLYSRFNYDRPPQWAMAIDLSRCTGCSSCVIACQAENNVPVVGADQCAEGREMHWIRIDQYRSGDPDDPVFHLQPLPCQQCENAPCEAVCPVAATSHNQEGLNDQVYNRCIGTRYCSNNCPYKVRRFNYFDFQKRWIREPRQHLMANPNVTVRQIGVMEKCTFCVQRINAARFRAANEDRPVAEGEVRTACQQACPAGAIVFGSQLPAAGEPETAVAIQHRSPRRYYLLGELETRPRVAYLAQLRNPVSGSDDEESS